MIMIWVFFRDSASAGQEIGSWIERLHVLVIGPGLGRDRQILNNTKVTVSTVLYFVSLYFHVKY